MLTQGQKNYLAKLEPERLNAQVRIRSYDPKIKDVAEKVMAKIRTLLPKTDIRFMGASALEISGQNDIDIYVITPADKKEEYLQKVTPEFGQQTKNKWHWFENGQEISTYLSDPTDYKFQEQLKIFDIFKNDSDILKRYEDLKLSLDNTSYKEYQIAKYEFYNNVLGLTPE